MGGEIKYRVVLPLDARPEDALGGVDLLLRLEEADREVLVELLVGEVDEELLEGVLIKVLDDLHLFFDRYSHFAGVSTRQQSLKFFTGA